MSAFQCLPETVATAVLGIILYRNGWRYPKEAASPALDLQVAYSLENNRALLERYGDRLHPYEPIAFPLHFLPDDKPAALFVIERAMACLIYQMHEGSVPDGYFFKLLNKAHNDLRMRTAWIRDLEDDEGFRVHCWDPAIVNGKVRVSGGTEGPMTCDELAKLIAERTEVMEDAA